MVELVDKDLESVIDALVALPDKQYGDVISISLLQRVLNEDTSLVDAHFFAITLLVATMHHLAGGKLDYDLLAATIAKVCQLYSLSDTPFAMVH